MRIKPVTTTQATPSVQTKLAAVQKKLGFVPNLIGTLGNSEAALDAYLSLTSALEGGDLNGAMKERIALITADHNGCEYCLAAHRFLAQKKRVPNEDILANGHSSDAKTESLIQFAKDILEKRGDVSSASLALVREAGYSDAQLLETVAHVSLNILTNFTNNLAKTEVDFPVIDLESARVVNQ